MELPLRSTTSTIDIYIKLAQYPILGSEIRARMREEIFRRGIISKENFEIEVKQKAIESQKREGIYDPFSRERAAVWQQRKERIREYQTDFYFGNNLPAAIFEQIVQQVLQDQSAPDASDELSFNPELAPWELLFRQGKIFESMPPPEQERISHHLEEIKAVLIKGMISDQLPYIGVARKVFDIDDLQKIHSRRFGRGKIGGKAAGMILAWKILQQQDPDFGPDLSSQISIPDSYFIGTEVIYEFRLINNLDHLMNQKYRSVEQIRADYPTIVDAHLEGKFPEKVVEQLRDLLDSIGKVPIIVRSSSLLEDNFGFSFAGKYLSFFCPNQDSLDNNLQVLLDSIRRIYASTLNPDAIQYRKKNNLIDYDERMAILLQTVKGHQHGHYFLPSVAGVGFSQNSLRWNPKIRREDGFLRVVLGLGTRAVDSAGNDYARLVSLSHPQLRPETTAKAIRQYSQRFVDLIDLEENKFRTIPSNEALEELIESGYPDLRYTVSVDKGDYIRSVVSSSELDSPTNLLVTFDYLTKESKFVKLMRMALLRLEQAYERPVDIEFTVDIEPGVPDSNYRLNLLQCRPLSQRQMDEAVHIPTDLQEKDIIFTSYQLIPSGRIDAIRYIIFVNPYDYYKISDPVTKVEVARVISRLNRLLEEKVFIMMGPGRWGSVNIDLGVRVSYADIYNTKALIEIAIAQRGESPGLSYGTHFYQDLVETGIHSLPVYLEDPKATFKWSFFDESANRLADLSPMDAELSAYLKVIDLGLDGSDQRMTILMDGNNDEAVAFLQSGDWMDEDDSVGSISIF